MSAPTLAGPGLFHEAVAAAVRAPSMHNTQPWRFRLAGDALEVYADPSRRLTVADPVGRGVRLACGAAVLNARLAFAVAGQPADVALFPDPAQPDLVARLVPGRGAPDPAEVALHAAIPVRQSNRRPFADRPVPDTSRQALLAAAAAEGGLLELLTGPGPLAIVAAVVRAADTTLIRDSRYRSELTAWSRAADRPSADGVPVDAGGPSPEPQDLLAMRDFGGQPRPAGHQYEVQPLIGVLGTTGDSPADQVAAGQALQRVLLTATDRGLAVSLLSQPIDVPAAREQLRVGLRRFGNPQMVLRIGYGEPGSPTPRRPLADVID